MNIKKKTKFTIKDIRWDYLILICMPFIMVVFVSLLNGGQGTLHRTPYYNDEVFWFKQIEAMVKYGQPLGYYGYNGSFAKLGRFATWGMTPIIPYAIFGKIFGWTLSSMSIANVFYLTLAMVIYVALVKPSISQTIMLIFAYATSYITIAYSLMAMSDASRYAFAIMLVAILIYFKENRCIISGPKKWIAIVVTILFMAFSVSIYLMMAAIVPFIIFYMLDGNKTRNVIYGILFAILITAFGFVAFSMTSAPYVHSALETIAMEFKLSGFSGGCAYWWHFFRSNIFNFYTSDPVIVPSNLQLFFRGYLIFTVIEIVVCIYCAVKKRWRLVDHLTVLWFVLAFLFGYCILYSGEKYTLARGINTGLIMAVFYLASFDRYKIANVGLIAFNIIKYSVCISLLVEFAVCTNDFDYWNEYVKSESSKLNDVIVLDESNDYWDNSIAVEGSVLGVDQRVLALPKGIGLQMMTDTSIVPNTKYILINRNGSAPEDVEFSNYTKIYEDEYFIILKRI